MVFARMLLDVTEREVNRPTVLVRTVHILPAGPRTRRLPTGKHGASGVEKPQETKSCGVAPRRKVGSLNRQLPGGHTSKVRCRSRCGANCSILLLERQLQTRIEAPSGLRKQAGRWPRSLALRSWLPSRPLAHRKALARKVPAPKPGLTTLPARFPARSICRVAMNQQAKWPSA